MKYRDSKAPKNLLGCVTCHKACIYNGQWGLEKNDVVWSRQKFGCNPTSNTRTWMDDIGFYHVGNLIARF